MLPDPRPSPMAMLRQAPCGEPPSDPTPRWTFLQMELASDEVTRECRVRHGYLPALSRRTGDKRRSRSSNTTRARGGGSLVVSVPQFRSGAEEQSRTYC